MSKEAEKENMPNTDEYYISQIIALDTIASAEQRKEVITAYIQSFDKDSKSPFYPYYKGRRYRLNNQKDSAIAAFSAMQTDEHNPEIEILKNLSLLETEIGQGISDAALVNKIQSATQKAEQKNSRFLYAHYDLMARAFYQNRNNPKSLEYTQQYYNVHPFKNLPATEQRYYDISFMLAARMRDAKKMEEYNNKARALAIKLNDSTAIARSFDNEAQTYAMQGTPGKAVESSRRYFNYLKEKNNLSPVVYNNLAASFQNNRQHDSAIHYYMEGIRLMEQTMPNRKNPLLYNGLRDAQVATGNYIAALRAADSASIIEIRNVKTIEEAKIAEVHERYEAEKKDRNIDELRKRNELNNEVISQQKWTLLFSALLFAASLFTLFIIYRQRLLRNKNALLKAENTRLQTEQKMLQAQLNPHFIFNAIANLQSLIGSGQKDISMQYLAAFSKLLRNILEQSRQDFIPLEEEVQSLSTYLNLQKMRFPNLFDYEINIAENIDKETTLIPPMLIQPFLENAVEHGFRNIHYPGFIHIDFEAKDEKILISIDDNGSGIAEKNTEVKQKKSLSGIILKERLDALFKSNGKEAHFEVIDKKNNGKNGVLIKITIPEILD